MNVGIVVSGGMAKGAYEIGALKAISELIPMDAIKYVSGASIGAVNSFAFVTRQLDLGTQLWKDVCSGNTRYFITQLLKSSMLQHCISSLVEHNPPLETNMFTTLYNANKRTLVYKNLCNVPPQLLKRYLQASVSIPIYNHAVEIGGVSYYDGAMIDIIPVFPLTELPLDYVICIYFDTDFDRFETPEFDSKVIKLNYPQTNMFVFRQDRVEEMVRVGYEHTLSELSGYFAQGWDNLDAVYEAIAAANLNRPAKRFRITADVLAANLNKVAIKFAKRKVEI